MKSALLWLGIGIGVGAALVWWIRDGTPEPAVIVHGPDYDKPARELVTSHPDQTPAPILRPREPIPSPSLPKMEELKPELQTITVIDGSCQTDMGICVADAVHKGETIATIYWLACRSERATCQALVPGTYRFDRETDAECSPMRYPGSFGETHCARLHSGPYDLVYSMEVLKQGPYNTSQF